MRFLRRPDGWVFVILLASYGYFWQSRDWNVASRLILTYALVDRGTLSVDGLQNQTGDLAEFQGHFYSDKTPGLSLLAVVPYSIAKTALQLPDHPTNQAALAHWPADYWITLGTSGLLSAWSGMILVGLARGLGCGPRRSALVGLAYGLGTPAFAYATLAYGHQVAAFGLLASFAILQKPRSRWFLTAALAGFLASFASLAEIQVGPVSAILGLWLIGLVLGKKRPAASILAFGLGAAIPALILLSYNRLAFGSPWKMGYFFEVLKPFRDVHSATNPLGVRWPDWSKLGELLWGERRGLIRFAPILLLTPPGLVVLIARRQWSMAIVSTLTMATVLLVNLSYPEWTGGWSTGPRLLVPMLPFALLPIAGWLGPGVRPAVVPATWFAILGAILILGFVTVGARVPQDVDRPLTEGVIPLLRGDQPLPPWVYGQRYARNLTSLAFPKLVSQLPVWAGWGSVVPLVLFQIGMIGLMTRFIRADQNLQGTRI